MQVLLERGPRQTQNLLEGLYIFSGLETPRGTQDGAGKGLKGERIGGEGCLGFSLVPVASATRLQISGRRQRQTLLMLTVIVKLLAKMLHSENNSKYLLKFFFFFPVCSRRRQMLVLPLLLLLFVL